MKKIIVMGLGQAFRKYEKEIYAQYEVIGVTSNYETEAELFPDYIPLSDINNHDYEYIMICSVAEIELINQLIDMGVEKGKILLASVVFEEKDKFHAQYNEDEVIISLLKMIGLNYSKVTYLELGTNHPIVFNNTYSLYRLGASGILVEPNRDLKNLIETVRPRDILINKAVSLDGKPAKFYSLDSSAVSTLNYDKVSKEYRDNVKYFGLKDVYSVETVMVNDLIQLMEKTPDIISIDIEGYDYDVLSQINYESCRPKIMIAEIAAMGMKEQQGEKIKELLLKNGYLLVYENGVNAIFVDNKYKMEVQAYMPN